MTQVDCHIPEYAVEEREKEIIIVIAAPLSKPKEAAFVLEKDVFAFDSPPYHLKMKLPHPVYDRFSQKSYNSDSKTYKIKLKKSCEVFEESDEEDEEILECTVHSEEQPCTLPGEKKHFYGFANKYSNMFGKLYEEFSEIISVPNPDETPPSERTNLRETEENEKWNDDHYLADTMETDHLDSIFTYHPPWTVTPVRGDFSDDEKEMLVEITKKSKPCDLSEEIIQLCEFQVVDVLFAYAYNKRTTEGDNTVESGWTINKLSSTLCWFEVFKDLKAVVLSCYRRSLIFPLYRNWKLAEMIHKDVVDLLKTGSKGVTRSLLEVREIFNDSDNRYILNTLYLDDMCNFTYKMADERCFELAEALQKVKITKYEVNNDLPLLEIGAHLALEELEEEGSSDGRPETRVKEVIGKMTGLNLHSEESESEDSDESSSCS